jgi:dihydroxyacid dehydratase/phosphogluconate dehydratase
VDSRRRHVAERAGAQIIDLVAAGTRPSDIMTREAFENAIRTLHAIGGSTNAVIHLVAIAGRLGVDLPIDLFDELAGSTPLLVNIKPSGAYLMEDFYYAGGLPAVHAQMTDLLHLDARTVTGRTMGEAILGASIVNDDVIRPRDRALLSGGSLAILRGSLCPDGAVLKVSAASSGLLQHEGRAVVFADVNELHATIDDPALEIQPDDVLVLQNGGPVGAPGMPEFGHLPMPSYLLRRGVTDMVRISDARMSGTGFGTVVLHVAPESAIGGPLALVRTGDRIRLDTAGRRLDLLVDDEELATRRRAWAPRPSADTRGYRGLYVRTVMQADRGCDLDFLVGQSAPVRAGITHG